MPLKKKQDAKKTDNEDDLMMMMIIMVMMTMMNMMMMMTMMMMLMMMKLMMMMMMMITKSLLCFEFRLFSRLDRALHDDDEDFYIFIIRIARYIFQRKMLYLYFKYKICEHGQLAMVCIITMMHSVREAFKQRNGLS